MPRYDENWDITKGMFQKKAGERLYVGRTKDTPESTAPQGPQPMSFQWLGEIPTLDFQNGIPSSFSLAPYYKATGPFSLMVSPGTSLPPGVTLNFVNWYSLDYNGVEGITAADNDPKFRLIAYTPPTGLLPENLPAGSPLHASLNAKDANNLLRWYPAFEGVPGLKWWDDGSFYYDGPDVAFSWGKIVNDSTVDSHNVSIHNYVGDTVPTLPPPPVVTPPALPLVEKQIIIKLSDFGDTKNLRTSPGNVYWQWSDVRGEMTSSGKGCTINANGDLVLKIKTRLPTGKYGLLFVDNYVGTNYTSSANVGGAVRVP